jgi:hypothetical protein
MDTQYYPASPLASDFAKGFDVTRRRGYPPMLGVTSRRSLMRIYAFIQG